MKLEKFASIIEDFAPLSLQEEWDNSGFQIKTDRKVKKVLVTLEINDDVIDEALEKEVDLVLTHHPLIFGELKSIEVGDTTGRYIERLLNASISVYSTHTPFDKCEGGNNDYLGKLLGIKNIDFMPNDKSKICRIGRVGKQTVNDFVKKASDTLKLDKALFAFSGDLNATISKVAWCTGNGTEFIGLAKACRADLFLTGDLKYHQAMEAKALGINVLNLGHFGTEYIFVENMANLLKDVKGLKVIKTEVDINPFTVL